MPGDRSKVFGIGLNKTGTTTLGQCARILGYNHTGYNRKLLKDVVLRNDFSGIETTVNNYEFFEDWPWPLIYRQLDSRFPGSKFILTTPKDAVTWFNKLKNHSMKTHPVRHARRLSYGYDFPHNHEQEHLDFYARHNAEVCEYFKNRGDDFIKLCWENGDGFAALCGFLGRDVPDIELPHANKGRKGR